jgi:hypothetical protein
LPVTIYADDSPSWSSFEEVDRPVEEIIVEGKRVNNPTVDLSDVSYWNARASQPTSSMELLGSNQQNEALDECSTERIELVHENCMDEASDEFNGASCGGSNIIFNVEGTIDIGIIELDLSLSIDNNQTCDDDNMALNSAYDQCDLEKAQKEFDCAAQ